MRMNVDRAGHHDLAGDVVNRIGALAGRRFDDAIVSDPDVANAVSPVRGIDDATTRKANQHTPSPFVRFSSMRRRTAAACGAALGFCASRAAKDPRFCTNSTPS